jgi:putative ABC transport system permease protein
MVVMGMGGIYRGLVDDALVVTRGVGADLWIVQRDTRGPFRRGLAPPAQRRRSRGRRPRRDRCARVRVPHHPARAPGQAAAHGRAGARLAHRQGRGRLPSSPGRALAQNHYEMIADESLGLALGERLRLGKDTYTVVGLTARWSRPGAMASRVSPAAMPRRSSSTSPANRCGWSGRPARARAGEIDFGRTQPSVLERASGRRAAIAALPGPAVSAVIARLMPGADAGRRAADIQGGATSRSTPRRSRRNSS